MPIYDYECHCGHRQEVLTQKVDPDGARPEHCGKKMEQTLAGGRQSMQNFESYTTTHIHPDGKPLKVRNSGDLKRYQREFGVYRVDDPGLRSENGSFVRNQEHRNRVFSK